jgi:hypothetical protein
MLGSVTHACLEAHVLHGTIYRPNLDKIAKEIEAFKAHEGREAWLDHLKEHPDANPDGREGFELETGEAAWRAVKEHAPKCAVFILPHLPKPDRYTLYAEHELQLDVRDWDPTAEWVLAKGTAVDLLAVPLAPLAAVEIYDYKTTKGAQIQGNKAKGIKGHFDPWFYVPTKEALRTDPQALIYAAYAMQRTGRNTCCVTFLYVCTTGTPQVKAVTVVYTRAEVMALLAEHIFTEARAMVADAAVYTPDNADTVSATIPGPTLPHWDRAGPCMAYGGCPHHITRGGICRTEAQSQAPNLSGLMQLGTRGKMASSLFSRIKATPQANEMRAPEAVSAAAQADPVGAAGLEVPTIGTEPPTVPPAAVPEPVKPKTGKPRRSPKDTDETFAERRAEWERSQGVIDTVGEEVGAVNVANSDKPKALPQAPTPAAVQTVTPGEALTGSQLRVVFEGNAADVKDLIRKLGGCL